MIKFSIITCTWNSKSFIQQTIYSVQAQTYPNIEHIFVDGGSSDGTLELIQSLQGNVKWVTGVRGGIAHAMNEGVKLATGDIIAHLHSDDYYLDENVIEDVAIEFERSCASWLFGRIKSNIDGCLTEPGWTMPKYSYRRLLRGNFIAHPATFVRREIFLAAGGFNPAIKYAMDYDLWLRLARLSEPAYLDRWLAVFRCHPGSLSSANPLEALKDDFHVRMNHSGKNPIDWANHYLHYLVRKFRAMKDRTLLGLRQ